MDNLINKKIKQKSKVLNKMSAIKVHSGGMDVFATPMMIAKMEKASHDLLSKLVPNKQNVGYIVNIRHLAPIGIGKVFYTESIITDVEGVKITFATKCYDENGVVFGKGTHVRVLVDEKDFKNRIL